MTSSVLPYPLQNFFVLFQLTLPVIKAKDKQLFQAASAANLSTISSVLAEYSPP